MKTKNKSPTKGGNMKYLIKLYIKILIIINNGKKN